MEFEDKSDVWVSSVNDQDKIHPRASARLDQAIFVSLCLVAFMAPQFIKTATFAFEAALLMWVVKLFISEKNYVPQPLLLPSTLFLVTAGIASSLSYVPLFSWERMGSFVLLPLVVVIAQNVRTLKQIKILVMLVLLSAMISALRTGWQYVHGIGTELVAVPTESRLFQDGLRSGDLVQLMNGHRTRSPQQWREALAATGTDTRLKLHVARNSAGEGPPVTYLDVAIDRKDLQQWLNLPGSSVKRGRPLRAQGHLDHYVRYAGVMMQLALLAFGLLLTSPAKKGMVRLVLAVTFVVLTAALFATVTRAYIIGLFLGCAFEVWLVQRKFRTAAIIGLGLSLLATAIWVRQERGTVWLSDGDQFRLEMWKESLELIPHHPWFGVGLDSVNQYGEQWHIGAYKKFNYRAHFHSTYVQLAVDCGLPCLAAWLWLIVGYLFFLGRSWKRLPDREGFAPGALLGIGGASVIFAVASAVHYTLADSEIVVVAWLLMGVAIALARIVAYRAASVDMTKKGLPYAESGV